MLLAALILGAAGAALFTLHGLPLGDLFYILAVTGMLCLILFFAPGYVRYARRVRRYRELKEGLPELLPAQARADTLPEALLLESIEDLCRRLQEQETNHVKRQADMLSYYTLWVHQVKTPMAAMRLILQSGPQADREALMQELFKIERYVEMVLGYLRLETITQDLRLEMCPVRPIAARAAKKFAPQFIYKKLTLNLEDFSLQVVTDEKWLLFVIEQLLSNAVKYTNTGGVRIAALAGDVLLIEDTGVGIGAEDLPRVFQRGFTGRNGREEGASTGLGLYLVKRVLDTLHTPIDIKSQPGAGTQVRLFLHREPIARD